VHPLSATTAPLLHEGVHCGPCGGRVEQTPTDRPVRWVHSSTGQSRCADGRGHAVPDAQRLYRYAEAQLDERYTLVWVQHDDRLKPIQIQALLQGEYEGDTDVFDATLDWEWECRWQAVEEVIGAILDGHERRLLEDAGLLEALRQTVVDRDDSNAIAALLRTSPHALFRYDLAVDVPDHTALADAEQRDQVANEIAEATGLDGTDPRIAALLAELLDHAFYGGRLYVVWYDNPENAIRLAVPSACHSEDEKAEQAHGTVTFTDAHLMVLDHFHGSGHHVQPGTLTVEWAPKRVSIDAPRVGRGYSWHEIAAPVPSWYRGSFVLNRC